MPDPLDELIHTKVAPPAWMSSKVPRTALLDRLDGALRRRLTLLRAPAGYGKTSALAQWRARARQDGARMAWLGLEPEDRDLARFARYLSLSLDQCGIPGREGNAPEDPSRGTLAGIVNRLLAADGPVVLILDDLDRAASDTVLEFLRALVRLVPGNCHLVLATRHRLPLEQSLLAAEDQLLELGPDALRFSSGETMALLEDDDRPIEPAFVHALQEHTEGWPIALRLVARSMRRQPEREEADALLHRAAPEIECYLAAHVLERLEPDIAEAAIRTALVDRPDGAMVDLLCGRDDGWRLLDRLERLGVFLSANPDDRLAFRFHPLFAACMRDRLRRRDGATYRRLQGEAAAFQAAHGTLNASVTHAIASENPVLLASIIEQAGAWRLIQDGLQAVVDRALSRLPAAMVGASPRLTLTRVYLAIKTGNPAQARAAFNHLLEGLSEGRMPADLRTEVQIVGHVLADYENRPVSVRDLILREETLRALPEDDHLLRGNLLEILGARYHENGRLERALELTVAARTHHRARPSLYGEIFTLFLEARIRHAQGRLGDVAAVLADARSKIEASFGQRSDFAANLAAFEAAVQFERNELVQAGASLDWSLPHMEQFDGWVDVYAAAYGTAARLASAQGQTAEAASVIARALSLAERRRLPQLARLARLVELDLMIEADEPPDALAVAAAAAGLDIEADAMVEESPPFRQVCLRACLCRARIALADARPEAALRDLDLLRAWLADRGGGRMLVDVDILAACAAQARGDAEAAQARFDQAVARAMFQDLQRPFLDQQRFCRDLVARALDGDGPTDRFREQFLRTVSRQIALNASRGMLRGGLTAAEMQVLVYLNQGFANKEIARLIDMSPDTVKYRLKLLFRKLGVASRREAVSVTRERALLAGVALPATA